MRDTTAAAKARTARMQAKLARQAEVARTANSLWNAYTAGAFGPIGQQATNRAYDAACRAAGHAR